MINKHYEELDRLKRELTSIELKEAIEIFQTRLLGDNIKEKIKHDLQMLHTEYNAHVLNYEKEGEEDFNLWLDLFKNKIKICDHDGKDIGECSYCDIDGAVGE